MTGHSSLPEPPYSVELLADLDAGLLDPEVADHIRTRLINDEEGQATLAALARTRAELADLPTDDVATPDWVIARTSATLAALAAESPAGTTPEPSGAHSSGPASSGPASSGPAPTPLRRRDRRPLVLLGAAAAIVAVLAVVLLTATSVFSGDDADPVQAQRPSADAGAAPTSPAVPTQDSAAGINAAALLAVLGRTDSAPFGTEAALRACTAANGVPATTPVVGSGPITLDDGPAAVILLATGTAGRFDALVVGTDCDSGNPATRSRTVIGG